MNWTGKFTLLMLVLILASGCVQTRPLVSHSHIGHALTTWHDTPGKEGLYTVAGKELDFAIDAAGQALATTTNPRRARKHLDDALHALNPELQRFGKGLDYGAIRALRGAIEHLEYAANSDDASDNFISSVVTLADQGDLILARMIRAQQLIAEIDSDNPALDPRCRQAHELLTAAKYGDPNETELNASLARSDQGLVHMTAQLNDMLARETDPQYEPVPKRYVLGLVRLPSGLWEYRLPKRAYASGGYSY